jgi:hypothetical protein
MISASPARVLQYYLVAAGKAVLPAAGTEDNWPITRGFLPSGEEDPDNYLATYDYGADQEFGVTNDSRNDHPAVQVRIRSRTYEEGWAKAVDILEALKVIAQDQIWTSVTVLTETILIQGCMIQAGIMHIGREEKETRENFTINLRLTISEG